MKPVIDLLVYTVGPVLYVLVVAGAVLSLVVGVMLIFDSARVMRWNYTLNRWYSTRQMLRPMAMPIDAKRAIYRWHRVLGALIFAGALYTLDVLAFNYSSGPLAGAFRDIGSPAVMRTAFDVLRIILIIGNVAALAAAAVLCFRPSLLKGLEAWGDQRLSSRTSIKPLEVMRYGPDDFVRGRPRTIGLLLTIGSFYILLALGFRLL
jgi:hypothetical protein